MSNHSALSLEGVAPAINEELVWKKVVRRTLPLLMICYILAYLDRINVSIAKLQMSSDLAFSDTVYGIGAGIFDPSSLRRQTVTWRFTYFLGAHRAADGIRAHAAGVLYRALLFRRGGIWLLSRGNSVSFVLVPQLSPRADVRPLCYRRTAFRDPRRSALRVDYGPFS